MSPWLDNQQYMPYAIWAIDATTLWSCSWKSIVRLGEITTKILFGIPVLYGSRVQNHVWWEAFYLVNVFGCL